MPAEAADVPFRATHLWLNGAPLSSNGRVPSLVMVRSNSTVDALEGSVQFEPQTDTGAPVRPWRFAGRTPCPPHLVSNIVRSAALRGPLMDRTLMCTDGRGGLPSRRSRCCGTVAGLHLTYRRSNQIGRSPSSTSCRVREYDGALLAADPSRLADGSARLALAGCSIRLLVLICPGSSRRTPAHLKRDLLADCLLLHQLSAPPYSSFALSSSLHRSK